MYISLIKFQFIKGNMNYEFPNWIKLTKKEEKQIEEKLKIWEYMTISFLNGFLFPITIPIYLYKKLKGG